MHNRFIIIHFVVFNEICSFQIDCFFITNGLMISIQLLHEMGSFLLPCPPFDFSSWFLLFPFRRKQRGYVLIYHLFVGIMHIVCQEAPHLVFIRILHTIKGPCMFYTHKVGEGRTPIFT